MTGTVDLEHLLKTEETGRCLGKTARTIRTMYHNGLLPAVVFPGSKALRFRPETLREIAKQFEMRAQGGGDEGAAL